MADSIRQRLLQMLEEHAENYVSGQMISETLNVSRTAIWKHVSELRKNGYEVEAVQKKGYRIVSRPDMLSKEEIALKLTTNFLGKTIYTYPTVESTQFIAHDLAHRGASDGTIIVADEQTAGKGRLGRSWHSPSGSGIWTSIILRPKLPPQRAPQFTLIAAVSVVHAIRKQTGLEAEIKWPNDILIDGKKVVGILTELQAEADQIKSIIIGMGINVNASKEDFPDELTTATSLKIESGRDITRSALLAAILNELETLYEEYLNNGFRMIKLLWESYAVSLGRKIKARTLNGVIEGLAKGITEEGVLLLEDESGKMHYIYSADIEIC
ncbi:biotin--[acetyl-CoA-carboxylase] ligase [Bacillus hwajinpoensis]|uniref:Bifunctional ligase/repressor BirA n=1 Tax=Guptibacillus hwajinpoensis TaxID=208199 RepID=A0A845EXU7_9BACL|nr:MULTISPECIES: biotin--[acetyl-CoA-carboxylase] ligase [Bacillaceae]MCA0990752.1 biotin--[acetyl-CoA-carboxylase] ligase [Pseudalkalibacillus hwajinpoensis]MYL63402.1 biotin--[acetyl-CoA-carboxylase] ligase [Pseudalkalibacillus hwajinpoensis]